MGAYRIIRVLIAVVVLIVSLSIVLLSGTPGGVRAKSSLQPSRIVVIGISVADQSLQSYRRGGGG